MSRPPAPGDLRLVQEFVNTFDVEMGLDEFASADGLTRWLRARSLITKRETIVDAELVTTIRVREALRSLLLSHHGAPLDPAAVRTLNQAAARAPLEVRFGPDGEPALVAAGSGVARALAQLLAIVEAARADGTWPRLRACADDTCQWAFYDHSKNRSGRWCSMGVCGNRAKTRTFRARRA